jgi:hypothetical protein
MKSAETQPSQSAIHPKAKTWPWSILAIAAIATIGLTAGASAFLGSRLAISNNPAKPTPTQLLASTGARNEKLSMATGLISAEVEGLWLLDHETGNLQCWVLSPRNGSVAGIFGTNTGADLGLAKGKPELLMSVGNFFFTGGRAGNQAPANSICYIANTATGAVAGYSLTFNRQVLLRGGAQEGTLSRVCVGKVGQQAATRDQ